jgi:ADP-ribose pyrophosphatase YjhB (NUDIX family)
MDTEKRFNVRVYGLLIRNQSEILVTDEFRLGTLMMKFPGGGLEFGEGTIDCLHREFTEELRQEINVLSHFYTTDYYQPTQLIPENQQLLSIYYLVEAIEPQMYITTELKFEIKEIDGEQSFRWVSIEDTAPEEFTFPIDQKVFRMLQAQLDQKRINAG